MGAKMDYGDIHSTFYFYAPLVAFGNDGIFFYSGIGLHFNKSLSSSTNYLDSYSQDNEQLQLRSSFVDSFWGTRLQAGYLLKMERFYLYAGITYNFSVQSKPEIQGDYIVNQNNVQLYDDHVNYNGQNLGFGIRLGWAIWNEEKFEDLSHLSHTQRYKHHLSRIIHKLKKDTIPKKIGNRKVEISNHLVLKNKHIVVKVKDDINVDGDIISLYFNGELVLKEYKLDGKEHSIHVKLKPGRNYLALYAVTLGQYPPCTAALSIDDGSGSHKVTLNSSLDSSGVVQIILKKKVK
jgi:hypothetical protein